MSVIYPDADDFSIGDSGQNKVEVVIIVEVHRRERQAGIRGMEAKHLRRFQREGKFQAVFVAP